MTSMLSTYVQGWQESADAVLTLVADLTEAQAAVATDCPGWTVQDVVAHLAHLESVLGSDASDSGSADRPDLAASYTEAGVSARRALTLAQAIDELRLAVARRTEILAAQLASSPDPAAPAPVTPGGIGWSWDTLLRNRCIDMWVHEQDLRRALGRPGGFDGTAAQIVITTFAAAMPYILGKRVQPTAGSTVRWHVTGAVPVDVTARMGDGGRANLLESADGPVTTVSMSTEVFAVLAAGRRGVDQVDVAIDGDPALGRAVLEAMAVTP